MIVEEVLNLRGVEGFGKMKINIERVATWTLVFTNFFFVSYFFGKLLQWG